MPLSLLLKYATLRVVKYKGLNMKLNNIVKILSIATITFIMVGCGGGGNGSSGNSYYSLAGKTVYNINKQNTNGYDIEQVTTMSFDRHIETVHIIMKDTTEISTNDGPLTIDQTYIDDTYPLIKQDGNKYYFEGVMESYGYDSNIEMILDTTEIAKGYVEGTFILNNDNGANYTSSSEKYYFDKNEAYENSN